MAEFVIKRIDATNPNSTKNIRGCYKAGDIIAVMEDGLADTMPHLTVIKVPNLSVEDAKHYMNPLRDVEDVKIRREYQIPKNIMSNLFPTSLDTTYTIPLATWNVWKDKIKKKVS